MLLQRGVGVSPPLGNLKSGTLLPFILLTFAGRYFWVLQFEPAFLFFLF